VGLTSTVEAFSHLLWNAWTYYSETYYSYSLTGSHDTDDIFKIIGSKVKVTDSVFEKFTFLVGRTNQWFAIKVTRGNENYFGYLFLVAVLF